jgi:hypothetical protein
MEENLLLFLLSRASEQQEIVEKVDPSRLEGLLLDEHIPIGTRAATRWRRSASEK